MKAESEPEKTVAEVIGANMAALVGLSAVQVGPGIGLNESAWCGITPSIRFVLRKSQTEPLQCVSVPDTGHGKCGSPSSPFLSVK